MDVLVHALTGVDFLATSGNWAQVFLTHFRVYKQTCKKIINQRVFSERSQSLTNIAMEFEVGRLQLVPQIGSEYCRLRVLQHFFPIFSLPFLWLWFSRLHPDCQKHVLFLPIFQPESPPILAPSSHCFFLVLQGSQQFHHQGVALTWLEHWKHILLRWIALLLARCMLRWGKRRSESVSVMLISSGTVVKLQNKNNTQKKIVPECQLSSSTDTGFRDSSWIWYLYIYFWEFSWMIISLLAAN